MTMSLITIILLPLLLLVCTKQTSSDEVKYGLGGYTMDDDKQQVTVPQDALFLKTAEDVKKYKTNDHADTQFKPCRVELDEDNDFELFYDEDAANEGCTVDFVMEEEMEEVITQIKVADTKMGCLEDCGSNELAASSKNIVPFTYSQSNEDFKKLHKGPSYEEDQTSCDEECTENGGKCMGSGTSLQLAWTKCAKESEDGEETTVRARAWIQLVGEPASEWHAEIKDKSEENSSEDSDEDPHEDSEGEYPDEAIFQLSIKMGENPNFPENKVPLFTVKGRTGTKSFLGESTYPNCFLDDALAMIPVPKFWPIKSDNPQINGKQLFVFHLLPQKATRIFNEEGVLQNDQAPEMPKCIGKLSIIFENIAGLLQSVPPEPTTAQTSEMTTMAPGGTTSTAPGGMTSTAPGGTTSTAPGGTTSTAPGGTTSTAPGGTASGGTTSTAPGGTTSTAPGGTTSTASGGATNSHKTTGTKSETTDALSAYAWIIVAVVTIAVVLLPIVLFLVWCLCCRDKKKLGKDAEIGKAPVKVAKQEADDEDSRNSAYESAQNRSNHEHEGVIVPDTVQSDRE